MILRSSGSSVQRQPAGVDAVDEEHLVDHAVEPAGFAMNHRGVLGNGRGIDAITGQELAIADDRRQWRAKLVTDRRQEPALGLIQPLQFGVRLLLRGQGGLDRELGLFELGDVPQIDQVTGNPRIRAVDRRS